MDKYFISGDELLLDSFKLAQKVFESGFTPDFIVGVWRGGAPVGIAVQEYLSYRGVDADHIAIRTSSYLDIAKQGKEIHIHGTDYLINKVRAEHKLLLVDDVFDSGRSLEAVIKHIKEKAQESCPKVIKIACPWFKPKHNKTPITPDFYLHQTEKWLVFPHELKGLSIEEIARGKGRDIALTFGDDVE